MRRSGGRVGKEQEGAHVLLRRSVAAVARGANRVGKERRHELIMPGRQEADGERLPCGEGHALVAAVRGHVEHVAGVEDDVEVWLPL